MDSFVGKYERVSAEKYDEFLKALDVNFLLRKAATASSPVMEVSKKGDVWTIKTSTSLKSMELEFEVGKPLPVLGFFLVLRVVSYACCVSSDPCFVLPNFR